MPRRPTAVRLSEPVRARIEGAARVAGTSISDILRQGGDEKAREILRRAAAGDDAESSDG